MFLPLRRVSLSCISGRQAESERVSYSRAPSLCSLSLSLSLSLDNALSMQARVSGVRFVRVWETKGRTLSSSVCVCVCVHECLRHVLC